jgi:hypothetical protein
MKPNFNEDIELGLMQEFLQPWSGDTAVIATCKFLMMCGRTRAEANAELAKQIEKLYAAGYRRVQTSKPKPR